MPEETRDSRLFNELHEIRKDLHALRQEFEHRGMKDAFEARVNELEIEERCRQIQDEIVEANKPQPKRGWFRRK